MFIALRFMITMMTLICMATFPSEWEVIMKLGTSILLLLYVTEDAIKTIKDMIKEIKGKKESEA